MPIPDAETRAIKEEIQKELMIEAIKKLAMALARRDRKLYLDTAKAVYIDALGFNVRRFFPPPSVQATAVDVKYLQETSLRDAVALLETTLNKALY